MKTRALTDHPYLVPFDGSFRISDAPTKPPAGTKGKKVLRAERKEHVAATAELQDLLYAQDKYAVLLVFQAMDAAGKDSTIRTVTSGVNPAGFQVFSFKKPSSEELDHDFLWRTAVRLPERGRIGIFNRSYYEETLVVQVHPEYLGGQKLPAEHIDDDLSKFWEGRYKSIADHEEHLARNGVVVVKFWLNISRETQLERFLRRIDRPDKNWKFEAGDVRESKHWDKYMDAYEATLNATSRPWAPWYAIPADDKPYMRLCVARIVRQTLESLDMKYPELDRDEQDVLTELRADILKDLEAEKARS